MNKPSDAKINEELIRLLEQENESINQIQKLFTLETFMSCIQDQYFSVPAKLKNKLLKAFGQLLLQSVNFYDSHDQQKSKRKKVFTYFQILMQRQLIFLPNQEQFKDFIEILLKLILGLQYKLSMSLQNKQKLLTQFTGKMKGKNYTLSSELIYFINQIQSSNLLRQLLGSCPNQDCLHLIFELCYVLLVKEIIGGQINMENQDDTIFNVLENIFLIKNFSPQQVKFYYNLIEIFHTQQSQTTQLNTINLYFNISTLYLIQIINQNALKNQQKQQQILSLKEKIRSHLRQRSILFVQNYELSLQRSQFNQLLLTILIASFLIGQKPQQVLTCLSEIEIDQKLISKSISTLRILKFLQVPQRIFNFGQSNLSFINENIQKLKQNPSKGLKFIDHQSTFTATISSQCQVNFKLKTLKSKENIVLFQLVSKNKRVEIVQKTVDSKFTKLGCLQYVKNQIKGKEVEQLFNFEHIQQFSLYFEKSKVKLHLIKKVNDSTQNLKLLEIQKFQSINSKINIGMIEGIIKETKNVEQIQKFTITSQSVKKDKTQLIQKTNIFKIALQFLQRNGQNSKNNDTKTYGFRMNNMCVKNYQNNFGQFAEKNNLKPIILKSLKILIFSYLQLKTIRITGKQFQLSNSLIGCQNEVNFKDALKGMIQLLRNIVKDEKQFSFDDTLQILIGCFLEKFGLQYQNEQSGSYLIRISSDMIKIISDTINPTNSLAKYQQLISKFLTSIINCSVSIFISLIQFFQQAYISQTELNSKHTLELFQTIIFHSVLLISEPKILKQEKTLIIQKVQNLLTKTCLYLSQTKLKYNQINQIQETFKLIIGILKHDKYENQNHQKMRRFKLSFLLVNFLKESFILFKAHAEILQNLISSSQVLCLAKIQYLKDLILKDQHINLKDFSNQTFTTSAQIHHENQNTERQIDQQTIVLSTKEYSTKIKNQSLKDKLFILSAFIDLYFQTQTISKISLEKFGASLQSLLNFINEKNPEQKQFSSQIINKSWIHFFRIFQLVKEEKRAEESYLKAKSIIQKLTYFGFSSLTDKNFIKLSRFLLFHPIILYKKIDHQQFSQRLLGIEQTLLKIIEEIVKKSQKLNQEEKKNIGNSLVLLLSRNPKILESMSIQTLNLNSLNLDKALFGSTELLQKQRLGIQKQFYERIESKKFQVQIEKSLNQQKSQQVEKKQPSKGLLKKQISVKQLNLKKYIQKELKIQDVKDEQIFRSQQPRSNLISQMSRKIGKNITEEKILLNHIQNLLTHINFVESYLVEISNNDNNNFAEEKIFISPQILQKFVQNSKDCQYGIDDYCDKNGMKMMLSKNIPFKKLPRILQSPMNIQNKVTKNKFKNSIQILKMVKNSAEIYSLKLTQKNQETKNHSKKIYDMMPNSPNFRMKKEQLGQYVDAFKVTLITNCQFYQGQLKIYNYNFCDFVESKEIDLQSYCILSALQTQQRKKNQVLKSPISFEIKFDSETTEYIRRKYLKVDNSIQIFSKNRSYFFVFKNQKQRDNFTAKINDKTEITHQRIHKFTKLWQKGAISNFQYLMEVNKFADRSFNDISQYYVFPWTVTNNKSLVMDDQFIKNKQNFRDLTKPIGKLNPQKFAKIKSQFQDSKKYKNSNRPLFLYSSFYSNPAIVSYYLIRLYPFSAHQFQLQSGKFDQSDRLFGSVQANYSAVYKVPGDFKELIPEFYYSPYFLKNLNQYDFGQTQNGIKINDAELPCWVRTQTPQQFVFRMRKGLQSCLVTQNLHKWIDLTFGIYAQKSKAQKYQNLYNQNVYGQNLQSQNQEFIKKYLKQFGESPRIIFKTEHAKNLMTAFDKRRMLKKSKSLTDILKQQLLKQQIKEYSYSQCEKLNDETESNLIKFNRKNIEKQESVKNLSKLSLTSMKSIKMFDEENNLDDDQRSFLMIKQNCLIAKNSFGFGYYNFSQDDKDPFDYKNKPQLSTILKCDTFKLEDTKNTEIFLISIQNSKLFAYKFNSKPMRGWKNSLNQKFQIDTKEQFKLLKSIGSYLILANQYDEIKIYTNESLLKNKKSKTAQILKIQNWSIILVKSIKVDSFEITDLQINEYLSIMLIKLNDNKFIVFDVRDGLKIDLRIKFQLEMMCEQKILKIQIHNMGYFLFLTNKNRFVLFNLLGQMILNIMVCFDKHSKTNKQQGITSTCFWSYQSSNILFSTNLGNIYKVDLFDMAQSRPKKQNQLHFSNNLTIQEFEIYKEQNEDLVESFEFKGQQKIVDMKMERRGRHWKLYCLGRKGNIHTLKNKYFDLAK